MTAKIDKLDRKAIALWAKVTQVLTRPPSDPIWTDEVFWSTKWIPMVDKAGQAIDDWGIACAEERKRNIHN
jgi:hypothetical protein